MKDKGHFYTSLAKSAIRIFSCMMSGLTGKVGVLAIGFLIAELLGIVEEIADER